MAVEGKWTKGNGGIWNDDRRGALRAPSDTNRVFSPKITACSATKGARSAPLRDCGGMRLTGLAGAASVQAFRPMDLVRLAN